VNLFLILIIKLISGLLSIGYYRSFPSTVAILFTQKSSSGMQKLIKLWTDEKQTGDSACKRYTLILYELLNCDLYHGQIKILFNEMTMISNLY